MKNSPIIQSMLDDDFYKFTMGSVVFHHFPEAQVKYEFINRNSTPFPDKFAIKVRKQIELLNDLRLTIHEAEWLKKLSILRPTYIEWLRGYRMNPNEVEVDQKGGDLSIIIKGPWYRAIFWEVKLMAIVSELYFQETGQEKVSDWTDRIERKAVRMQTNGCRWIDFGTRRRYSFEVQDAVVLQHSMQNGFMGTSNPYLAFRYNLIPCGTYAHEAIMGMSALCGVRNANKQWMKIWSEHFGGKLGIALTDTFTTDVFLKDFGNAEARLWDGCRHDSGDPFKWAKRIIEHFDKLDISISNKKMVFSDGLNDSLFIDITNEFKNKFIPIGGIGTFLTNDVGPKPLNIVIKMTEADFGNGPISVVKLSDNPGKHNGSIDAIELAKKELNIK